MIAKLRDRGVAWLVLGSLAAACDDDNNAPSAAQETAGDGHTHSHDPAGASGGAANGGESPGDQPVTSDGGVLQPPPGTVIGDFRWNLPKGFPLPFVPEGNPMSIPKVELGRRLFYDKRLSDNETQSCASCHKQAQAFTDGRATGLGSTGEAHPRGPMAIMNLGYAPSVTWGSVIFSLERTPTPLEDQTHAPLYGIDPIELGMASPEVMQARLRDIPEYEPWFAEAFPDDAEPITSDNMSRAIAAFERTLISGNAPYDRYQNGDDSAYNESQMRGYELFNGEKLECFHCHSQFNLTDNVHWQGKSALELRYHNTGLYNIDGKGAYPAPNTGLFSETGLARNMGLFKAPSLRNVAVTAPYMHDGSIKTLSEVLDHYAAGGRTIADGPHKGVGSKSPLKDSLVRGFELSEQERADVIAFLETLTDEEFLTNRAFADPWEQD
jgi:cytochrome c peroxidase